MVIGQRMFNHSFIASLRLERLFQDFIFDLHELVNFLHRSFQRSILSLKLYDLILLFIYNVLALLIVPFACAEILSKFSHFYLLILQIRIEAIVASLNV